MVTLKALEPGSHSSFHPQLLAHSRQAANMGRREAGKEGREKGDLIPIYSGPTSGLHGGLSSVLVSSTPMSPSG